MKIPNIEDLHISTKDDVLTIVYKNRFTWTYDYRRLMGVDKSTTSLDKVINLFLDNIKDRQLNAQNYFKLHAQYTSNFIALLKESKEKASMDSPITMVYGSRIQPGFYVKVAKCNDITYRVTWDTITKVYFVDQDLDIFMQEWIEENY